MVSIYAVVIVRAVKSMDNTPMALYTAQTSTLVQTPVAPTPVTPTGLGSTPVLVAIVTGIMAIATGVVTGWLTAVYAPKANWEAEKEKLDYKQKKRIVKELRKTINDEAILLSKLSRHPFYHYLELNMSLTTRNNLETDFARLHEIETHAIQHATGINLENKNLSFQEIIEYANKLKLPSVESEVKDLLLIVQRGYEITQTLNELLCKLEIKWGLVKD